jgi:hypothetical protein
MDFVGAFLGLAVNLYVLDSHEGDLVHVWIVLESHQPQNVMNLKLMTHWLNQGLKQ